VTGVPKLPTLWQSSPMATNHQRLMSTARRLLASRADAEDAVQDTYVRALAAFPDWLRLQPPWLYTVLRNVAIDRLRRKRLESEQADAELPAEGSSEPLMEVRSECEAALRHLLSRVSPAEAAAILLMDMLQMTTARAQPAAIAVGAHRGARSSSMLVQVNGRYAIALVLDGVVLCIVPVGTQGTLVSDSA